MGMHWLDGILGGMARELRTLGDHLREWRQRRRMSQLDLACEADISARHLSFLETGRAQPSRDMLLHLAERLDVPLRERNVLLVAAGYAPMFRERALDDPALSAARAAVDQVLSGHEPFPALAVDRHWNLVAANRAVAPLLAGVASLLMEPPINVLRIALHPEGLAPRTVNFTEWRAHLLARLRRQVELTAEPKLVELLRELESYPAPRRHGPAWRDSEPAPNIAVPFQLRAAGRVLSFFSTVTVFGTPLDITLSELAIEAFFPADAETAAALRGGVATAVPD
jgi:transcriptional regulator with XRE-family HTH domain